jgi:hypothetical protein
MFTNIFVKYTKLINLSNININNLEELKNIIEYKFKLKKDSYYLIHNGKLFSNVSNLEDNDTLKIILKTKGGELFFLGQMASILGIIAILVILMKPLIDIIKIVVMIIKIVAQLLALFPQIIETILLVFNPKKLMDDIIFGVTYGIKLVVGGMMDSMDAGTKSNKEEDPDNVPKVCIPPSLFNLFVLIICPPLALLINYGSGLNGIFLVVICTILTVWCYYFPGLIFAAMHILC